jgi:hypothetical protein
MDRSSPAIAVNQGLYEHTSESMAYTQLVNAVANVLLGCSTASN